MATLGELDINVGKSKVMVLSGTLMKNMFSALVITIALSLVFGGKLALAQPKNPVSPDLIINKPTDIKLTYNLGATGLRGWIYTKPVLWPLSGNCLVGTFKVKGDSLVANCGFFVNLQQYFFKKE